MLLKSNRARLAVLFAVLAFSVLGYALWSLFFGTSAQALAPGCDCFSSADCGEGQLCASGCGVQGQGKCERIVQSKPDK